jgi:hypothetical protein
MPKLPSRLIESNQADLQDLVQFAEQHGFQDILTPLIEQPHEYTFKSGRVNATKIANLLGIPLVKARDRIRQLQNLIDKQIN